MVTATRTDAPTSQVGASATVFTADDLERLQKPLLADLLVVHSGRDADPQRRSRHRDVAVRARRRKRLQQDPARRRAAQRAGRHVLSQQPDDRKSRSDRDRARRLFVALRIGRDGQRDSAVHEAAATADSTRPRVSAQVDGGTYGTLHTNAGGQRRAPALWITASARRDSTATTGCRTAPSRTRRSAPTSAWRLRRERRCDSSVAANANTSARQARPRSDGRISMRFSSGTTASAACSFDQQVNAGVSPARLVLAGRVQSAVDRISSRIHPIRRCIRVESGVFQSSDFLNDSVQQVSPSPCQLPGRLAPAGRRAARRHTR